jgi:predicted dehydrogenase
MIVKVGLVGYGFAGRTFHAPVVASVSGLELTAIVQRSTSDATERYPQVTVVGSVGELLKDEDVRLIVIATPNATHFELARECLQARRHVVIDKPFTTTSEEALTLTGLADKHECLLTAYHNRRWDGDFLTVQRLIADGVLGEVVHFRSSFDRFRPEQKPNAWRERPEPGSGVLFDLGPHLIDQALVLFGKPDSLYADVRSERMNALVDDAFDVQFLYPALRVHLGATMLALQPRPRFALDGTQGSFVKYGLDPQEEALRSGAMPVGHDWGSEPESQWGELALARAEASKRPVPTERGDYRRFYENVRDAISGTAALAITPRDAYNVMRILELTVQSSHERRVVPVEI